MFSPRRILALGKLLGGPHVVGEAARQSGLGEDHRPSERQVILLMLGFRNEEPRLQRYSTYEPGTLSKPIKLESEMKAFEILGASPQLVTQGLIGDHFEPVQIEILIEPSLRNPLLNIILEN